jgi:uncharacterized protein DUF1585
MADTLLVLTPMTQAKRSLAFALLFAVGCVAKGTVGGTPGAAPPAGQPPMNESPPGDNGPMTYPFEKSTPSVYVSKVKNLLTGLGATPQEVSAVSADPLALKGLIDQWMATPEYRARLLIFFKQAFQQTQVITVDYQDQLPLNPNTFNGTPFLRSMEEVLPRTAMQLIDEGKPFTEVVTTRRFMLSPPLMALLAYADNAARLDNNRDAPEAYWVLRRFPGFSVTFTQAQVPLAETLDPQSPNFMVWTDATPLPAMNCRYTEPNTQTGKQAVVWLTEFLFGFRRTCGRTTPQFSAQDWTNWRMVDARQPNAGEQKTLFWDIPALETATELVLDTPRVGFMTTPAFLANWQTNTSNQARVTTNQTMIVALGMAFDDRGVTVPVMSSANDQMHAQPGTPCYSCHQTLDPMRDFFRESYSYFFSNRYPSGQSGIPATATFTAAGSTPVTGNGIAALASAIAQHPRFAIAWTQKLCRFANSVGCSEDDPEFQRVAEAFRASSHDFKTLVRELFSSPLVTYASSTKSATDQGVIVSIARRDSLCTSLSNRLGMPDACGLWGARMDPTAANLASAVPSDGYARGAEAPLLPTDPDLFFQSGTNNLCIRLAERLVDAGAAPKFSSANKDKAIHDMINVLMGVPDGDPRVATIAQILNEHDTNAANAMVMQSGTSVAVPTLALRSTFTVACTSPLALSSGL